MEKKEFVNSFIDTLNKGDNEKIYKFFTNRTQVYDVKNNKEWSLDDLIKYLKEVCFNKNIEVVRIFESHVCIKYELKFSGFEYDAFLFEIKDRRFSRVELM